MHERQALVVTTILFFSIIFVSESFAQVQQCNGLDATRIGSNDRDIIRGTSGDDVIVALGGNDLIFGNGGNDVICGGAGNDRIYGNSGNDILIGQAGSDRLNGGSGNDSCDSSSEDGRISSCENQYQESTTNNDNDLQKQINDLQTQINNFILGLINWADIQGVPESLADGDNDMLAKMECDADQILVYDGVSWVCDDIKLVVNTAQTCQGDLVNFAGLSHGDSIEDIQKYLTPYGMTVSASGYGKNPMNTVIIYDSNGDDGKDSDLEVGIGNLVIIPDKIKKPSDSGKGGKQIYEFVPPRIVESFVIVDIESKETGTVTAYNSEENVISSVKLTVTGNKSYQTVNLDAKNVAKLVIDYDSSGALTNICLSDDIDDILEIECSIDSILTFDGEKWVCSNLPDTGSTDTLLELNCETGQIVKKNGEDWECSVDEKGTNDQTIEHASSAIFFHYGLVSSGQIEWVSTSVQIFDPAEMDKAMMIMPSSGTLSNLFAKTGFSLSTSPGLGESYKLTILVNGQETIPALSCAIVDDAMSCSDKINIINVNEGDSIVLQIEASNSAPFAIISSSALLTSQ